MYTVKSYAKINLGLGITGKRADGYHELDTVFQIVSLHDDITFSLRQDTKINLKCSHKDVPEDDSNLCCKAAMLLQKYAQAAPGVDILIEKRIPVGAGLGGGSSNAAATLVVLNDLWRCNLSIIELHTIALTLGADVPFFIKGGTAHATGIGDRLEQLEYNVPQWVVMKYPDVAVSTQWAYKNLKLDLTTGRYNTYSNELLKVDILAYARNIGNDFEQLVFENYQEIEECKMTLLQNGAIISLLSGSGSTVFGLFESKQDTDAAVRALSSTPGEVFVEQFIFENDEIIKLS